MKTYVITGATGNTGKPISLGLLESGHRVRVITRNAEKAQDLKDKGAEVFVGNNLDESFLNSAFSGADAVYALLPMDAQAPDYTAMQVAHATAIKNALVNNGIKYAVTLSSVGAHLNEGTGVVLGLHKMEELFNAVSDLNVKHIRATYFMENTLSQLQAIKHTGSMGSPVNGSIKFAMVAAKDVAATALKYLQSLDFYGKSIAYVLGQRDISYNEIAEVYGKAIGHPGLKYIDIPFDQFSKMMLEMGMGESMVANLLEFTKAINEGKVADFYKRTPENNTSTSIEEFAQKVKRLYNLV
jgi:uncharacterized protein YbjT (DUF2867 family)